MLSQEKLKQLFFPHQSVRKVQDQLIEEVDSSISQNKNLIVHAPTGLGKSAATLPIALSHALKKGLTVFFLTSRHTQHIIAIDTLKQIKNLYSPNFISVDIIGKKWMCPIPGTDKLYSNEFAEYCKSQREEGKCEFYSNTRKKSARPTVKALKILEKLKEQSPCHCEDLIKLCIDEKLCPYELSTMLATKSSVIIADYYYIFHPTIRDTFFKKAGKELAKSIIIIDEGHNLPKRTRDLMTARLSNFMINRALKEAKKFSYSDTMLYLKSLKELFQRYLTKLKTIEKEQNELIDEVLVKKQDFVNEINHILDYDELTTHFEFIGDSIREKQKKSYISSIANFLTTWLGQDQAFARILSKKQTRIKPMVTLSYRCLDPSLLTKEIVNSSYSTIIMSGTLTPTSMYQDLLGFNPSTTTEKEYGSPFPGQNKLSLIIPETTTKFTQRNQQQYKNIAAITANITNLIPGNCAIFFPSYQLRDDVNRFFQPLCRKTTFLEQSMLSKTEKEDLLERFKQYKDSGAVLLGVASGSFSQGIDLPGDLLKAVIVVGLPLQRPDLETKELIDYYENKYKKGWDYGYIFPAITKCLQSAGRCIRSETDRGVLIFLDQRFAWPNYRRCFPDSDIKITKLYKERIEEFFNN